MPRKTPQQSAEKWARKMAQAGPDYVAGIQAVTVAPGQLAARNESGYQNGVNQAVATGKWRNRVGAVPLQSWQDAAVNKGAARLAQGAAQAVGKVEEAHARIGPMIDRALQAISGMGRGSAEERIARATAYLQHMHKEGQNSGGRR